MSFENPNLSSIEKKFEPKYSGGVYQGVEGTTNVEEDARFREMFEEKCLAYLKAKTEEYNKTQGGWFFSEEHSGELALSGYLLDKRGNETPFLPSQNIGADYEKLKKEAIQEFADRYPEDVAKFGLTPNVEKPTQTDPRLELARVNSERLEILMGESYNPMEMNDYLSYVSPENAEKEIDVLEEKLRRQRQPKEVILKSFKEHLSYVYAA